MEEGICPTNQTVTAHLGSVSPRPSLILIITPENSAQMIATNNRNSKAAAIVVSAPLYIDLGSAVEPTHFQCFVSLPFSLADSHLRHGGLGRKKSN